MTVLTWEDMETSTVPPAVGPLEEANLIASDKRSLSIYDKTAVSPTDDVEAASPSRHLWVGNLSTSLTKVALSEHFARFGEVEDVAFNPSRNYAFVDFKNAEDAAYAKKGLQKTIFEGSAIRIEFARAVKACKHLWVSNICSSVTKDCLEEEFEKFGKLENLHLVRDQNGAFVDFINTDDAKSAHEALNRKKIGKNEVLIEFVRSQPQSKKDGRFDVNEVIASRDHQRSAETHGTFSEVGKSNAEKLKRDNKDGDPSEVLWVGFPIYMKVDERKLRRVFAPFGAIERITTFPGRTYAFVQFQSLKAASRAKDALQGNLFNDPRVSISFAKSEVGPADHNRGISNFVPLPPKAELPPLIPLPKAGHAVNPRNDRFLGHYGSRAVGNRSADDFLQNPRYEREHHMRNELGQAMKWHDHGIKHELNFWGSPCPMSKGVLPHHSDVPHVEEMWNAPEEALGKGEIKRQRIGADHHPGSSGLVGLGSFEAGNDQVLVVHDSLCKGTFPDVPHVAPSGKWESHEGPVRHLQGRPTSKMEPPSVQPQNDWAHPWTSMNSPKEARQWRGLIAKSGTSVCRARSHAVSNIVDIPFPEIVNCTARTSLDMLANYINQVGDFAVVSFIPEGELDAAPYQDFIKYLSERKRAAVCKLSLESTLFLVPPSEFVERFLKVPLHMVVFGVILRLPPHVGPPSEVVPLPPHPAEMHKMLALGPPSNASLQMQHPWSDVMPTSLPYNPLLSAEAMLSTSNTQPQQAGLQFNVSNPLSKSIAPHTNAPDHRLITSNNGHDEHLLHQSLSSTGDLRPHQEQGIQMHFHSVTPPAPIPEKVFVIQGPDFVNNAHPSISGSVPFPLHPATPSLPPPNMQPYQSPSAPVHQSQPSHSLQQPPTRSQLTASGTMHVPQQALIANFGPTQETGPKAGVQQPSFSDAQVDSEVKEMSVEAQQHGSLHVSQRMVSTGTEGDGNKRFQATLQLAAALLQQLQQKTDT